MPGLEPHTLTFSCWGHPLVRATHDATLELTLDREISRRATCVVGVRAEVRAGELSGFVGPVTISLRAGPLEEVVHATAHPGFRLERSIVVRRSEYRARDTFATGADRAARDLPRDLTAALTDPDVRLLVKVSGERSVLAAGGVPLTVVAMPEDEAAALPAGAPAALAGAELVVAGRDVRRALRRAVPGARAAACDEAAVARALDLLRSGRPVTLARTAALGGESACERRLVVAAVAGGVPLETVGFSPETSALLVSGLDVTRSVLVRRAADPRAAGVGDLAWLGRGSAGVWRLPAAALADALAEAEARLGDVPACAVLDPARPAETAIRGTAGSVRRSVAAAGRRPGEAVLVLAADGAGPPAGGPEEARDLLAALSRQGVPDRVLAGALTAAWGWRRRRAYAEVQALKGDRASAPEPPEVAVSPRGRRSAGR